MTPRHTEETIRSSPNGSERQHSAAYAVRSDQNGREKNEDSFHIFSLTPLPGEEPLTLLAVADGMGGHEHGELVSIEALRKVSHALFEELVVEPTLNRLDNLPPFGRPASQAFAPERLTRALLGALEQANAHVRRMVEMNGWTKAGSTAVVVAVYGQQVVAANLGDSPLFHFQTRLGRLHQMTDDHTVAGVLLRAGMIGPEMARVHEGRSRLEFYLGVENMPKDEPSHIFQTEPGDLLLLCSDGISGSLTPDEIESTLREPGGDLEVKAERLIEAARATGDTDNQTLILWRQSAARL